MRNGKVAQVHYYGWALKNRGLFANPRQLDEATEIVESAPKKIERQIGNRHVVPSYARQPKSCMGGWGRRFLNVTPAGKVPLPCQETLKFLEFDSIRERSLAWIWENSKAF